MCNGILFNHRVLEEANFVTRKITRGLARIDAGLESCLYLGNLMQKRLGTCKDYVNMQWLMLQQDKPDDYVIATGRMETVRTFIEISAEKLNWQGKNGKKAIIWEGSGLNEVGRRSDTNEIVVKVDKRYFRPTK